MRNIYVPLPEPVLERLRDMAARELRGTKEQAAWLIVEGLRRWERAEAEKPHEPEHEPKAPVSR